MISGEFPTNRTNVKAKIRYKAQESEVTLYPLDEGMCKVVFSTSQRAITKGQSIVFTMMNMFLEVELFQKCFKERNNKMKIEVKVKTKQQESKFFKRETQNMLYS